MKEERPPPGSGKPELEGTEGVTHEVLMRYLDGELTREERERTDEALKRSGALRQELELYRHLQEDLSGISFGRDVERPSVWARVNQRLVRPLARFLVAAGVVTWLGHSLYIYATSPAPSWEEIAVSGIAIAVLVLLAAVIHERYREMILRWDPDAERDRP